MSKSLLLAAAAVVGIGTVTAAYYVSPVGVVANDTPPILVDAPAADIVRKIRQITIESYLLHSGVDPKRGQSEIGIFFKLVRHNVSDTETVFEVMRGSDLLMQFRVLVKPVEGSKSEIDVQTAAGESKFRSASSLHPSDIILLQSVADFLATDYVSSLIKGHPMLLGARLEDELEKRFGQDADASQASVRRIKNTFVETYAQDIKDEADSFTGSADDWNEAGYGEPDDESEPASDASPAASDHVSAADEASRAVEVAMAGTDTENWGE